MTRSTWMHLLAPLALLAASAAGAQDAGPSPDGRYMVKFRDFNGASQAVAAAGGQVVQELGPQKAVAAYLPEQALEGLRRNPNVEYVEVDPRRYLMGQVPPYGIGMVQATDAAFPGTGQGNVTVCIIDSGYHEAHEDLPKEYQANVTGSTATGTNVNGTGSWNQDSCGHGTHVAGTVAALNNDKGVVGVSSNGTLRLHIVKVFDGADCAWTYSSNLVAALNVCRNNVPSSQKLIVSMSLGGSFSSTTENTAFQDAYNAGVLSVAAAGNDGSTRMSYPASYGSVVSVAAVDASKAVASFSQKNSQVELAAPGVGVLSTTPFKASSLAAGGNTWIGANLDGSARTDVAGTLVSGGLCDATNAAWSGMVVLCQRGTNSFADKVSKVQSSGGRGAVIYNNVSGGFAGTLNGTSTIPGISISLEDGQAALGFLDQASTLANTTGTGNGYEYYDGTSMATPHVSGVAALVWSQNTAWTNAQLRDALQKSAKDLGAAGRDTSYGFGLVQAKAALDYLNGSGGGMTDTISLGATKRTTNRKNYADLTWSGSSAANVDVYRNNVLRVTTANDGKHTDGTLKAATDYRYKVCNAGTTTCSNEVMVRF
jgi:subtilisin family serine protease